MVVHIMGTRRGDDDAQNCCKEMHLLKSDDGSYEAMMERLHTYKDLLCRSGTFTRQGWSSTCVTNDFV